MAQTNHWQKLLITDTLLIQKHNPNLTVDRTSYTAVFVYRTSNMNNSLPCCCFFLMLYEVCLKSNETVHAARTTFITEKKGIAFYEITMSYDFENQISAFCDN